MRDAISVLIRLGVRVTGAEASKRGDVVFELHRNTTKYNAMGPGSN
jgi:hypothetical protein